MKSVRQPRSVDAATALCERWAELDGQIVAIEERRQADIAAVNADADRAINDLVDQRDAIASKIEPWWASAGKDLTKGKRKSIELGGCIIGTREGKASLQVAGDAKKTALAMRKEPWAKRFLRISVGLDKAAILKAIAGRHAEMFAKHGLSQKDPEDTFFVTRAEQGGTRGGAAR